MRGQGIGIMGISPSGVNGSAERSHMRSFLGSVFPSVWRKLPPGPVTVPLGRMSLPTGVDVAPSEPVGLETILVLTISSSGEGVGTLASA
jgi:hypothetical protein